MDIRVWLVPVLLIAGCGGPVRITGNHIVSDRELQSAAQWPIRSWEKQGNRPADLADAAEAMRSYLEDRGFAYAKVDFLTKKGTKQQEAHFTVKEGIRVAIGRITLPGRRHLDRRTTTQLKEGLRPWYAPDLVNSAAAHLEQEYRRVGFIIARVDEPVLKWSADRATVDVAFPISEGPRFVVTSERLEFIGDPPPGSVKPLTALLDRAGMIFDPRLSARTASRLRAWLLAHGYIDARIDIEEHLDGDAGTAAPVFRVAPGRLHVLGFLRVRGKRRTAHGFIASRLTGLHSGKPIDQTQVDRAVSGLYATGLFTAVTQKETHRPAEDDATVISDLTVRVTEAKNQRFDLSVGYGSYEQLRGGIDYVDEHFAGQGLRVHGGVDGSLKGWSTELGIRDPFRFGPGRSVGVEVGYREREEPSFEHREFTGMLDAVQRFRPRFDDEARWELRGQYEFKRAKDFAIEGALPDAEFTGYYRTSTVSARIRRDDRGPRVVDPERGTMVQVGVGWNAELLGSNIPYTELGGDWSGHLRLLRRLTGVVHIGYSQRDPSSDRTLPIGERLFLGGEDTVRSFTQDQLGPADADGSPVGGLSRGIANAELRWRPLASLPNVEVAGFYDIGAIGQRSWRLDSPPGQAVGGGLRYITPVGPIRLDAAYNPGERFAANDVYAIHFAVGFAF